MKNAALLTISCLLALLAAPAPSEGEEFLLYAPKPATGDQAPVSPDQGVLVKRVTVKRGDTLSRLSREHIGAAGWFPQVLVFNSIKNPDLIYAGDSLLIPVPAERAPAVKKSAKRAQVVKGAKAGRQPAARRPSPRPSPAVEQAKAPPEARPARSDEQQSYQRAKRAYLAGEYQKAQALFSRFLQKYPNSNLAPDASLYRADCFLQLAGQ